jgi:hypothetical protein
MKNILAACICMGVLMVSTHTKAKTINAARSVHLWYHADQGKIFYNEVQPLKVQNGTYFQVCGFNHGYFGMQQLQDSKHKVILFSVWDPGNQNNPNATPDSLRVQELYHDPAVTVKRFGGEGTGAQSFYHYQWKLGHTYRFAIEAEPQGELTAYTAYFYLNKEKRWLKLATFATHTGGQWLSGYYSFVEDFRRDIKSVHQTRKAIYKNGHVMTPSGIWEDLNEVTFTADSTPLMNIDAEVQGNGFLLETGGDVVNHTPLNSRLIRPPSDIMDPGIFMTDQTSSK